MYGELFQRTRLHRTIEGFSLGLQTRNSGPELDSGEIERGLLHLLQRPQDFQDAIRYWQRRSHESGGTTKAVEVIQEQARLHESVYRSYNNGKDKDV